jgi:iron complex outermembrane recepter protein
VAWPSWKNNAIAVALYVRHTRGRLPNGLPARPTAALCPLVAAILLAKVQPHPPRAILCEHRKNSTLPNSKLANRQGVKVLQQFDDWLHHSLFFIPNSLIIFRQYLYSLINFNLTSRFAPTIIVAANRIFYLFLFFIFKPNTCFMRRVTLLSLLILYPMVFWAQTIISGKISDAETKSGLAGATISAGNNSSTLAGTDGSFLLKTSANPSSITVSFVGYEVKVIKLGSTTLDLDIRLTKSAAISEVIVTGSRNLSRTRVETPVAVDVIPLAQITNSVGQIDINQLLTFVAPSFQSSRQTISDGTDHVDPAQLRGLGTDQVLVLVNGKRRHQSALVNVNGTVNRGQVGTDLNAIPATAVERIEVLRDGAAAQYGSDAIAGVINIVLKKSTNGLSGNVSYGANISSYPKDYALSMASANKNEGDKTAVTDGQTFQAGLNYGIALKQKGFINLNGEYNFRNYSNRVGTYTGQIYPSVNGANKDDSIMAARGTNRNTFDMRIGNSRIVGGSLFVNSQYALGGSWKLSVFGGYSKKNGEAAGFYRYPNSVFTGAGATYRNQALAVYPNGFLPLIKTNITDLSISAGATGLLGKWSASLSNTFGVNNFDFSVDNSINYSQLAVSSTPQNNFDAGGLKFLQNTLNADMTRKLDVLAGLNVAFGAEFRIDQYGQKAGEPASYTNYSPSSGAAAGAQVFAGFTPTFAGNFSRENLGLYVDLEQDITDKWLVAGALRFENYSDFGNTLNYKLATRYKISKWLTARAATSTGFRAPSMQQRFYAKTNTLFVSTPAGVQPVESGTFPNGSVPANILGIPTLKEETSANYSAGITLAPMPGLEITVDGYIINIDNRIVLTNNFTGGNNAALAAQLAAAGAQQANFFTNAIDTRNRGLEAVVNYSPRLKGAHKLRLTVAATFIDNEVRKDASGKPIINATPTLVASGQLGNYFNREDQSRIEVANPRSKANLMANYSFKKLTAMVRVALFGEVQYLDPTINPANPAAFPVNAFTGNRETLDQTYSGKAITDLSVGYQLHKHFTLTLGANNLLDVYQDKQKHSGNVSAGRFIYSRRVQQMGFNGRYLFARVAFNFAK